MARTSPVSSNPMPGRPISIDALLKQALGTKKLGKAELKNVVNVLGKLESSGIQFVRGFPYGIPAPDGVGAQGICGRRGLAALLRLLTSYRNVREVAVFPIGIPFPDVYRVDLGVGKFGQR